jgi:UDP-N-acetylmuramate dehydrogenase
LDHQHDAASKVVQVTVAFSELTTMRVGGPVGDLCVAQTTAGLLDILKDRGDLDHQLLVIGGGSNLVVGDIGFAGTVVKVESSEVDIRGELVTAAAGVEWDHLVRTTVANGLAGLEALSGVPGSTGGTPVQNVGAYGALTSDVLESVTIYDRQEGVVETWGPERCGFGPHRQSVFKHSDRWVVVDVTFRLRRSNESDPIKYADLAGRLGVAAGGTAPVTDVRDMVLSIRRGKGMVLDPDDHDTWSVGSFFLNPVVAEVPPQASGSPQFHDVKGTKLSAAWLIHQAGFPPGYGTGPVALSSRHTLAITNRGGATTADVMAFAAHIRDGVQERFGVRLTPECALINCSF